MDGDVQPEPDAHRAGAWVHNHVYEDVATKFFEHFLSIAEAMTNLGDEHVGLWDETDQFYYDVLCLPDGSMQPLKVRSMVGLIPLLPSRSSTRICSISCLSSSSGWSGISAIAPSYRT